jgi:hypothetical protein
MRRRDTPCNRSAHLNNRWAEPHPTVKAEGNRPATTRTTRSVCAGAGERVDLPALRATNARAGSGSGTCCAAAPLSARPVVAVIGTTEADQIRHTAWHATLAELFVLGSGW